MAYTPIIPGTGLAGWTLLKATQDRQVEVFNKSPDIARDVEYFRENIGNVETLDDFMSDRKLLKVALGAFGLGEEINKGAFVRKVLEGGTTDERAYAVRLNNPDYLKLAGTFAVEDGNLSIDLDTVEKIIAQYQTETFEEQVGTVDETMRLALNFEREIADLAGQGLSENSGWFKVMGSLPLRAVFESAFNLPDGFSQLDIDRQKDILSDRANQYLGEKSIDVFKDPEAIEKTIRRFLMNEQINAGPSASTPGYAALTILGGGLGSAGIANLLLSNVY